MTTRETILQAARDWFKIALAPDVTDANAIVRDDGGPRPALPYLTFKVILADLAIGTDETVREIDGTSGNPTVRAKGIRSGTLSVQGFGSDSVGWLEVATLRLIRPSVKAVLDAAGLTIITIGGVTDLSALIDNEFEDRFLREFQLSYAVVDTDAEELTELLTAEVGLILEDREDDPDPFTTDIIVTL